jgi:hypothetical protein
MNKEYISYGVIGIVLGLVLGFLVANGVSGGATGNVGGESNRPQESVNSSSASQPELPPGHPPINPNQPTPAPPLPADGGMGTASAGASSAGAAPESAELPSLDPLPASSREERAEHKYKNIQLFKGLPAERITKIMFAFKSSLGVECTYCHVKDQFDKDDKPTKQMARKMITLVRNANNQLGGAAKVTCFTCHRGQPRPPS